MLHYSFYIYRKTVSCFTAHHRPVLQAGMTTDPGMLFQMKCLIERTNIESKVTKDYHADSVFFDLVVDCHVVAAAMTHLGMEDVPKRPAGMPQRIEVMPDAAKDFAP
jgi:hypothetical protein